MALIGEKTDVKVKKGRTAKKLRTKGVASIMEQIVGKDYASERQTLGGSRTTVQSAATKVSGSAQMSTERTKAAIRRAAASKSKPKAREATMDQREEGILVESIRRIDANMLDIKQEIKTGNDRLEAKIDRLDDKFFKAILLVLRAAASLILILLAALLGFIGGPMLF